VTNEERFHAFYTSTQKALYGYLYRVIEDAPSAQDLFQEAYLKLLSAKVEELDDVAMRAYLFRIATNLVRDRYRKQRRERQWAEKVLNTDRVIHSPEAVTDSTAAALERMTPQSRSLLLLAYVEEYDHKQIATMLGLGTRSVRVLLFRAKKRMITLLRDGKKNQEIRS
jgi:RNA polymerase sigma-70 factor (ECF subfamily)